MSEIGLNTNLASEFYVMSLLLRRGEDAHLTLGNKKAVDILIYNKKKPMITIDVKGLKGKTSFPVDNLNVDNLKEYGRNHFIVFVSFLNAIADTNTLPEVYIVPANELSKKHKELGDKSLIYVSPNEKRKVLPLGRLRALGKRYKDNWDILRR
jgi:hypothetical protein